MKQHIMKYIKLHRQNKHKVLMYRQKPKKQEGVVFDYMSMAVLCTYVAVYMGKYMGVLLSGKSDGFKVVVR